MMATAYHGPFPIISHRTMAEVMRDERTAARVQDHLDEDLYGENRRLRANIAVGSAQLLKAIAGARP